MHRIEKVLKDAQIKLGTVASDLLEVSGKAMLEAIARGETDAEKGGVAPSTGRKGHGALSFSAPAAAG